MLGEYKEKEEKQDHSDNTNQTKYEVHALNINTFLDSILESPEKLNTEAEAILTSMFATFDIGYIEKFLSHEHELLGNFMFNLMRVNWNIIPSNTDYIPMLIHYAFDVELDKSSFQLRLTILSKIIEKEMTVNKFWDVYICVYIDNIQLLLLNKEAMIVFVLCCIHCESCDTNAWDDCLKNEFFKCFYKHISACDLYSNTFLQCLNIITSSEENVQQIISFVDMDFFIKQLYEKANTNAFNTIVVWRIESYPDERVKLLYKLNEIGICDDLVEMDMDKKVNIGNALLLILDDASITDVLNEGACINVVCALLEVTEDMETIALRLYAMLISRNAISFFNEEYLRECCETLMQEIDATDKGKYEEEAKIVAGFICDDDD